MANPDSKLSPDLICVSFGEAVDWVAFSNFGGKVIGPQPINRLFDLDRPDPQSIIARRELAVELLLNYAARGKIKLYAWSWVKKGKGGHKDKSKTAVPPEFIANSYIDDEEWEGLPALCKDFGLDTDEYECYRHIVVDHDDLINVFWGKEEETAIPSKMDVSESALSASVPRVRTRRGGGRLGRPAKHKWAEFVAATVERCLRGPIPVQEDLVREMLEWCVDHWGEEPAISLVRDYVAPIFRQFEARWRETPSSEPTEKSEPALGT